MEAANLHRKVANSRA